MEMGVAVGALGRSHTPSCSKLAEELYNVYVSRT